MVHFGTLRGVIILLLLLYFIILLVLVTRASECHWVTLLDRGWGAVCWWWMMPCDVDNRGLQNFALVILCTSVILQVKPVFAYTYVFNYQCLGPWVWNSGCTVSVVEGVKQWMYSVCCRGCETVGVQCLLSRVWNSGCTVSVVEGVKQ